MFRHQSGSKLQEEGAGRGRERGGRGEVKRGGRGGERGEGSELI